MTREDFDRTCELLRGRGFVVEQSSYDHQCFGSWWVSVAHHPPLRIVWGGKDGWAVVQRQTSKRFQGLPIWQDLWVGRDCAAQTADFAVSKFQELSSGG
jgi:hypothetical protein